MAKIEFTSDEIEVMKKVAEEYHNNGAEKAKALLESSGISIDISPEVENLCAPDAVVKNDNCYACISCLFFAAVALVNYSR